VTSAVFDPAGSLLLGDERGGLLVWDILAGQTTSRYRLGLGALASVSAPAGPGLVLTASVGDSHARSWDATGWVQAGGGYPCAGGASCAAAGAEGDRIFVAGRDGALHCYEAGWVDPLWSVEDAHAGPVTSIAVSSDGGLVATSSFEEGAIRCWGTGAGGLVWEADEEASCLAFTPSDALVTGPSLRSGSSGSVIAALGERGPAAASPDGRFVFTAGPRGEGALWYVPALLAK
jgi:WD40 repeat protein